MQPASTIIRNASMSEMQTGLPSDELVRSIFAVLSNRDSFEIFMLAARGIDASTEILRMGKFSRKRYYVRLGQLIKLGLVHKEAGRYVQTSLGMIVSDTTKKLEQAIVN